jgi:ferredoxin
LADARELVSGLFLDVAKEITTEDSKKIRELVRNAAIRDDRRLSSRELDQVANAAVQIREALQPLVEQAEQASGAKKGAIRKHINRVRDALLAGQPLKNEDVALVAGIDQKNLEKARRLGKGLLADVLAQADDETDLRELTNDLCLRTDGKISKEDLDAIVQWSLKYVREGAEEAGRRFEDIRVQVAAPAYVSADRCKGCMQCVLVCDTMAKHHAIKMVMIDQLPEQYNITSDKCSYEQEQLKLAAVNR